MRSIQINKEQLQQLVSMSVVINKTPIAVSIDSLKMAFGFVRKSGVDIMMTQLLLPSKTEEEIQTLPPGKLLENIKNWCEEVGYIGYHDPATNHFIFHSYCKPKPSAI